MVLEFTKVSVGERFNYIRCYTISFKSLNKGGKKCLLNLIYNISAAVQGAVKLKWNMEKQLI